MSLLPRALQFRDEALSLPLGAAKVKPEPVKVDPNAWFEAEGRRHANDRPPRIGKPGAFAEALAAQPPSTEKPPKFAVGQKWKTRDGAVVEITAVESRSLYALTEWGPFNYGLDGTNGGEHPDFDLIELVSPSEPKEADGWIEWKGGECPIQGIPANWSIRLREGIEAHGGGDPRKCRWEHTGLSSDIVAYRLVKQQ